MTKKPTTRREMLSKTASVAGLTLGGLVPETATTDAAPQPPAAEVFDVTRFGAKRDGVTDDTAAAQAAVNAALKVGGGRIHFPAGNYRLTRTLRFASQARIDVTGDGFSTTLRHENDEPLLLWPKGVSCREVTVRHLRFLSVGRDKSPTTPVIACQGGVERSLFSHLLVFAEGAKIGSGIVTEGVADTSTIENCVLWGVSGVGIRLARGSEMRVIGGRVIGDGSLRPGNTGLHVVGNNGGVHVVTTDLIGLHTSMQIGERGQTSNREIFITHATFDSSVHGLVQVDHAYTSLAGCWSASADEEQILLDQEASGAILSVSGGTIFNGGAYSRPGAHHGIVVRAGRFTLTGVHIRHNKGIGILVEGDAVRDYAITGCRIHDNGTGASLRGNGYVLMGNIFADNGTHLHDHGGPDKQVFGNVLRAT
jgi:hypothetical protein